jgi:plastocyanin
MTPARRLATSVTLLALGFTACAFNSSSDDPGVSEPPKSKATATTAAPSSTAQAGAAAPAGGCAAAAGLSEGQADHGSAPASGTEVAVVGGDFFFQPTCSTGVAPGTVKVKVRNTGQLLHNISVTEQGLDRDIDKGQTIEVEIKVAVGTPVHYFCKYHKAAGMIGVLIPG